MTLLDTLPPPTTPMRWEVLSAGYTTAPEGAVIQGGSWFKRVTFQATAVLLRHPRLGVVLFDTSYAPRFLDETKRWPGILYGLVTPVKLSPLGSLVAQLAARGIAAADVRHIFVSHFHGDHIAGLRDFPQATFYCSETAWRAVQSLRGFSGVRHGFLPGLVPDDFAQRVKFIDHGGDVFGDGSARALALPGHATGQMGLWFRDDREREILLAADACWLSDAYRRRVMPHAITRALHDWDAYASTLGQLHELHRQRPKVIIVPCHCPETAALIAAP